MAIAKPLVGAATAYFLFNTLHGRDGDRAVGEAAAAQGLERELPAGARRAISSAPASPRGVGVAHEPAAAVGRAAAAARRCRSTSPTTATRSISGASRTSAATRRRWRTCTWRRSKRWRSRSTRRTRRRSSTSAACSSTPPRSRAASGMSENEIQGVKTAALLHDIGKLAVPEHILSKPGPLTPEEFQKIRAHPKVGADIVSSVPFPYPVAPLILSHHERWDGKGYPAGLKGEEIPLGARILSVVDYFDALMAERPYHKAMTSEAAIGAAAAGSGQGARPAGRRRCSPSCCRRCRPKRCTLDQNVRRDGAGRRHAGSAAGDRAARPSSRRRTSSRTSRSRTARSTRSTRSRRRWAPASASPTRWRSSRRS